MKWTLHATFDGEVFRPEGPPSLEPNTRVRMIVETVPGAEEPEEEAVQGKTGEPYSFFHAAREAGLDGPADWSERLDHYLYGQDWRGDE